MIPLALHNQVSLSIKDKNAEGIVIGELNPDMCQAKNKATTIATKLSGFLSIDLMQ